MEELEAKEGEGERQGVGGLSGTVSSFVFIRREDTPLNFKGFKRVNSAV